jgi:hypothetical protein
MNRPDTLSTDYQPPFKKYYFFRVPQLNVLTLLQSEAKHFFMKIPRYLIVTLLCSLVISIAAQAQDKNTSDSTGLPGDQFSLDGALELFKKAGSPEEFEKLLNTEDNHVNNLDLNGDGEIDYVRVIDKMENNAHVFVLQVPVSASENQDIAVIELEKTGDQSAVVQIIGDEDIYGEQVIVEPGDGDDQASLNENEETHNGPFIQFASNSDSYTAPGIIVNVWVWPMVRFVYAPAYTVWVSPWRWRTYPGWYRPWRPLGWYAFHPYRVRYHYGFAVVHTHRVAVAHRIYRPMRVTSVTVRTRNSVAVNNYRVTRRSTTVTGPRGNSYHKTTTTVHGRHGNVRSSHTTVRKKRRG